MKDAQHMPTPKETIWFGIERYSIEIKAVRVAKETEKTISIIGKYGRSSGWTRTDKDGYYRTWEEAHTALLARCEGRVDAFRLNLEVANRDLLNVRCLKKPEPATS